MYQELVYKNPKQPTSAMPQYLHELVRVVLWARAIWHQLRWRLTMCRLWSEKGWICRFGYPSFFYFCQIYLFSIWRLL